MLKREKMEAVLKKLGLKINEGLITEINKTVTNIFYVLTHTGTVNTHTHTHAELMTTNNLT